jgi:hypothetical protein
MAMAVIVLGIMAAFLLATEPVDGSQCARAIIRPGEGLS